MHTINIEITEHVCLRFIERFNQNLNAVTDFKERLNRAQIAIKSMLMSAHYVSDDERGVLLHSPIHKCNLIIRDKKLITLYHPEKNNKIQNREKKYSNQRIVPSLPASGGREGRLVSAKAEPKPEGVG